MIGGLLRQLFGRQAEKPPRPPSARPGSTEVAAARDALARAPGDLNARWRLAGALVRAEDYEAAQDELEHLLRDAPRAIEPRVELGHILRNGGRIAEAIDAYRQVLALDPGHAEARSNLLLALNYRDDCTPQEVFAEHRAFGERFGPAAVAPQPDRAWPRRLRVGYVSPDFRSHVVASFMLPILARHDRERFELCCYHTFPGADTVTDYIRSMVEHWVDAAGLPDAELAQRIRDDRIDILVDLAGHMAWQRLGVFALRPAPVQATYLGYPNTTGLRTVDYRISDARADPPGRTDPFYTERIVRLDRSFVCYRPGPDIHAVAPLPAARAGHVTFGSFNNFQKLSGSFFTAAARVLSAVPGSRLLLKAKPLDWPRVAAGVRERCAAMGIAADRLDLRGWTSSVEDHLGEYRAVDIALDSFPYNGTTTTCEAMWMGAPVVALEGDRHCGCVGSSLLSAVGLPELVARDVDDYVRIAAALAADTLRLTELRTGMRERMRASPLMDEKGFVSELERAYLEMWQERLRAAQ